MDRPSKELPTILVKITIISSPHLLVMRYYFDVAKTFSQNDKRK